MKNNSRLNLNINCNSTTYDYEENYSMQARKYFTKNLEHTIKSIVFERRKILSLRRNPSWEVMLQSVCTFPMYYLLLVAWVSWYVSWLIEVITIKATKDKLETNPFVVLWCVSY